MPIAVGETQEPSSLKRLLACIIGKPKNIHDPSIFHKLALIPALAWVGLGADGLSSSSYGPEEAFKVLGEHTYLCLILAILTIITVFIISYSYVQIIEHFPSGGGGYIVATKTIGKNAGLISGCALLIDYILTITVSIASCGNTLFSSLPEVLYPFRVPFEVTTIVALSLINIRGVKESITLLVPIFVIFVLTHIALILCGIFFHLPEFNEMAVGLHKDLNYGLSTLGATGMLALLMKAYSLGAGTYTGIEAVSNGLQVMKEPKADTAKTTMLYMAVSLAFTAGGIYLCYLLLDLKPVDGKTLNALVAENVFGSCPWLVVITIVSEAALLIVGSQTGFIDGPRIMANMATDKWLPSNLANLSERLTMRNGILLMGMPSIVLLLLTDGDVSSLVVMYSINVFITFSISQLGMCKYFFSNRTRTLKWLKHFIVNLIGFLLCFTILTITSIEKFTDGGYITLAVTALTVILCYSINNYYNKVKLRVGDLQGIYQQVIDTNHRTTAEALNPKAMTAIHVVNEFNGFGINIFFAILTQFPDLYKNFVFVSAAKVNSSSFTSVAELKNLEDARINDLKKYVELAGRHNIPATYFYKTTTNSAEGASALCLEAAGQFPKSTVFVGLLQLQKEAFYHKLLHSDFPYAMEKLLQQHGLTTVVLPIKADQ